MGYTWGSMRPFVLLIGFCLRAQTDWPTFGNDPGAMRYSPLRQIDAANVAKLTPAWIFRTNKPGSEAVPVVIGGVMYVNDADGVYALVPETGQLLWNYAAPQQRFAAWRSGQARTDCMRGYSWETARICWRWT